MFGKLLKYEFKATARVFLPLLGLLVLFTGTSSALMAAGDWSERSQVMITIKDVSLALFVITAVILAGAVIIMTIQRVRRTLLGDEGYITFTLPVSTDKILLSKLLVSFVWWCLSILLGIMCVLAMCLASGVSPDLIAETAALLSDYSREFTELTGYSFTVMALQWIFTGLLAEWFTLTVIMFSMAVGHLVKKGQLILSIGVYFIICNLSSVFTVFQPRMVFSDAAADQEIVSYIMSFWGLVTAEVVLGSVVFYLLGRYILNKHLNLQ